MMDRNLRALVVCPLCKSSLHYCVSQSILICRAERLAFRVEDGRPVLLADLARKLSVDEMQRLTGLP